MISPWLIDALYQIAKLLCVYTPSNLHPISLIELYTGIESGRKEHNQCCKLADQYDEEWDITHSPEGYSLFYTDAPTRRILIKASDADDQLQISIGNKEHEIFYAVILGNRTLYRYNFCERFLRDDTHIAFLQLLDADILNGWLFDKEEKIQKLPSYALH